MLIDSGRNILTLHLFSFHGEMPHLLRFFCLFKRLGATVKVYSFEECLASSQRAYNEFLVIRHSYGIIIVLKFLF